MNSKGLKSQASFPDGQKSEVFDSSLVKQQLQSAPRDTRAFIPTYLISTEEDHVGRIERYCNVVFTAFSSSDHPEDEEFLANSALHMRGAACTKQDSENQKSSKGLKKLASETLKERAAQQKQQLQKQPSNDPKEQNKRLERIVEMRNLQITPEDLPAAIEVLGLTSHWNTRKQLKSLAGGTTRWKGGVSKVKQKMGKQRTVGKGDAPVDPWKAMLPQFFPEQIPADGEPATLGGFKALVLELTKVKPDEEALQETPRWIELLGSRGWSPRVYANIRAIFGLLGGDHGGVISFKELRSAARALGLEPSNSDIHQAGDADTDDSQGLDYSEFLFWVARIAPPKHDFESNAPHFLTIAHENKWTHQNILDFKLVFSLFDADGDETINISELCTVMRSLGHESSKEEIMEMISDVDVDGSGSLDFVEFLSVVASQQADAKEDGTTKAPILEIVNSMNWTSEQILGFKRIFKHFDLDGDETISTDELRVVFRELGGDIQEEELQRMISDVDRDGSGEIDFIEFLQVLSSGQIDAHSSTNKLLQLAAGQGEEEENDEHELKQLLLSVDGIEAWLNVEQASETSTDGNKHRAALRDRQSGRNKRASRMSIQMEELTAQSYQAKHEHCAEKLLECIKRVMAANRKNKLQEQIQEMILDMCRQDGPPPAEPGLPWRRPLERWIRYCRGRNTLLADAPNVPGKKPVQKCDLTLPKTKFSTCDTKAPPVLESAPKHATLKLTLPPHVQARDQACSNWSHRSGEEEDVHNVKKPRTRSASDVQQQKKDIEPCLLMLGRGKKERQLMQRRSWFPEAKTKSGYFDQQDAESYYPSMLRLRPASASGKVGLCSREHTMCGPLQTNVYDYSLTELCRRDLGDKPVRFREGLFEASLHQRKIDIPAKSLDGRGMPEWRKALAETIQLEVCEGNLQLPKWRPDVQVGKTTGLVEGVGLANNFLDDAQVKAAVKSFDALLATGQELSVDESQKASLQSFDASGNCFSTMGLEEIMAKLRLESLTSLDLSRNVQLCTFSCKTADTLAQVMKANKLRRLRELRLERLRLPRVQDWEILAEALPECSYLEVVSLADTHLGQMSGENQCDCIAVAAAIGNMASLKSMDLSANFFLGPGCQALASTLSKAHSLEILSLAGNSGGFIKKEQQAKSGGRPVEPVNLPSVTRGIPVEPVNLPSSNNQGFPPLQTVAEALPSCPSLRTIDLSCCQIGYEEAFILETATMAHQHLGTLLLADNPLGTEGLICIIRLIVNSPQGKIEYCDLMDIRTSQPQSLPYDAVEPAGYYRFNLALPHQRAVLGRLLLWCSVNQLNLNEAFSKGQHSVDNGASWRGVSEWSNLLPMAEVSNSRTPQWKVAQSGLLNLICQIRSQVFSVDSHPEEIVSLWLNARRSRLTLGHFVTITLLWKQLNLENQREMLAEAIGRTCILKWGQLKYFVRNAPNHMSLFIVEMLYPCLEGPERLALLDLVPNHKQQQTIMREALNLYYFNPANPAARYKMSFKKRIDIAACERIMVMNSWHKFMCDHVGLKDCTEHGNGVHLRNTQLNGKVIKVSESWIMPSYGSALTLYFDYVVPLRPSRTETIISDRIFDELLRILDNSNARWYDKFLAVRCLSHKLVLAPDHLEQLLFIFPIDDKYLSPTDLLFAASEMWDELRVEVFVILFSRIANREAVCNPESLYNDKLIPRSQAKKIRERLGTLNTLDVMNVCQMVYSNLGNRFEFDLATWEGHKMMEIFLKLIVGEDKAHMGKCWYSEAAAYLTASAKDGSWSLQYDFLVPVTWLTQIPDIGTIRFEYQSAGPHCVNPKLRHKMGEQFLNWDVGMAKADQSWKMCTDLRSGGKKRAAVDATAGVTAGVYSGQVS